MSDWLFPKPFESDLVLIFPPFERPIVSMENVGIEYIASYARARGFEVRIINAGLHGLTSDAIISMLKRSRFRLLGVSTIHWTLKAALDIARAAKDVRPDCHVVLGGIEAAFNAKGILTQHAFVDSIGIGEGEVAVTELLSSIARGSDWKTIKGLAFRDGDSVALAPKRDLIDPLDLLPFPARDDIAAVLDSGGPVSISTSRGCMGRCSFCSVWAFYGLSRGPRWRGRSPASVVEEISLLHETYGVRLFSFIDETVIGPGTQGRERLREIGALLMESQRKIDFFLTVRADQVETELFQELKQAGLKKVEIGIESMAASQLRRYGKNISVEVNRGALRILEDLDIQSEVFMIPFDPQVTYDELQQNLSFYAERFKKCSRGYDVAPLSMGNYLYPYPGTSTRALYRRLGWLDSEHYVPFRAKDGSLQRAGRIILSFTSLLDSAFPASYLGLGNLWTNSKGLPEAVYRSLGRICAITGTLLVEVAEWAYAASSSRMSIHAIEAALSRLREFLSRLASLREEVKNIVDAYGSYNEQRLPAFSFHNDFARQLYLYGRERKQAVVNETYRASLDPNEILPALLNVLTKEDLS